MFTPDELQALRPYGIAVHRDKIVLDARPPIEPAQLREVEQRLTAPVPSPLRALWRTAFGGSLDYDLQTQFGKYHHQVSLRELFYPGSDHCHDLLGWLDHDREFAAQVAAVNGTPPPTRLEYLPIGGFEYLERVYVSVREPDRGHVFVWAAGLPPKWKMCLTADSTGFLAEDVDDLFDQMRLDADPFTSRDPTICGTELVAALGDVRADHPTLAAGLEGLIRDAIFDWRRIVTRHTYAATLEHDAAMRVALDRVTADEDLDLLAAMIERGYPLDQPVSGVWPVIAWAAARGAGKVALSLLASGKELGTGPILFAGRMDGVGIDAMIGRGLHFDPEAALSLAGAGKVDVALTIAKKGTRTGDWKGIRAEAKRRAESSRKRAEALSRGEDPELTAPIPGTPDPGDPQPESAAAYLAQAEALQAFARRL